MGKGCGSVFLFGKKPVQCGWCGSAAAQAAVFAGTAILIASHGAPHANTIFMPAGGVVIEVLNCGHYTDVSRKLITETGHLYMSTMDNASLECQSNQAARHSADDRALLRAEWEPALLEAMRSVDAHGTEPAPPGAK